VEASGAAELHIPKSGTAAMHATTDIGLWRTSSMGGL